MRSLYMLIPHLSCNPLAIGSSLLIVYPARLSLH